MAIDVGAKAGYIDPDDRTLELAKRLSKKTFTVVRNDADLEYQQIIELDVSSIEPQVACPPTVGNVVPIGELESNPIQLAEIGGQHRRPPLRSAHGRRDLERKARPSGRAPSDRPRHGRNVPPSCRRRHCRNPARRGRHHVPARCRLEPGRQHGRHGFRRSDDIDSSPELSRTQWKPRGRALPRLSSHCRRVRDRREDRGSATMFWLTTSTSTSSAPGRPCEPPSRPSLPAALYGAERSSRSGFGARTALDSGNRLRPSFSIHRISRR